MTAVSRHDAPHLPDEDVIRRVLGGHTNEFGLLVDRYGPYLYRLSAGMIPAAELDETVQEIFVRAYAGLTGFDSRGSFKSWLAGIAVRTCQDHWRQQYRRQETTLSALSDDQQTSLDLLTAGQAMELQERRSAEQDARDVLYAAMSRLSETDRTILTLVYLENFSIKDAAAIIGCTRITAKVRAHRARKALQEQLQLLMEEGS